MNMLPIVVFFSAVFLTASPLMAQMDEQQPMAVINNEEEPMGEESSMQEEGYDETDQEYNEAEVNAEIPDEYFNDETLVNDDIEQPAAENVDSTVSNVETAQ